MLSNFLETANPFALETPPPGFLAELFAYDPLLVVFASIEDGVYRIARRVRHGAGVLTAVRNHPDTEIFVTHRLIPVTSILPTRMAGFDVWSKVIPELASRDTWRYGSNDEWCDRLDATEAAAEAAVDRQIADGLDALSGDAYRLTKSRLGERLSMRPSPKGKAGRFNRPNLKPGGSAIIVPSSFSGWGGE